MTVATGIETGAGGASAPSQGKASGVTHGTERAGTTAPSVSGAIAGGAESFRTGLQSLLASLGSSMEAMSATGRGAEVEAAPVEEALGRGSGRAEESTSTRMAAGADSLLKPGTEKGIGEAGAGSRLSAFAARTGEFAGRGGGKAGLTGAAEKRPATEAGKESVGSGPAHSAPLAKDEVVAVEPMRGLVPAGIASLSNSAPVPAIVAPVAQFKDVSVQTVRSELPREIADGGFSASFSSRPSNTELAGGVAAPARAGGRETTKSDETIVKQGRTSPLDESRGQIEPTSSGRQLPSLPEVARASVVVRAEDGNALDAPAPEQNPSEEVFQDRSRIQTIASNSKLTGSLREGENIAVNDQISIKALAAQPHTAQTVAHRQTSGGLSAENRNPTQTAEPGLALPQTHGLNLSEPTEPGEKAAQVALPSLHRTPGGAGGEDLTEALARTLNPPQATVPGQNRSQALASSQNSAQTFIQSQNALPLQPGTQAEGAIPGPIGRDGLDGFPGSTLVDASPSGQLSAVSSSMNKPGAGSGQAHRKSDTARSARGAGDSDSVQAGNHPVEVAAFGSHLDGSAGARELIGARGTMGAFGEPAGGLAGAKTGPDPREVFATLDAGGATGKPVWIHAGSQRAEAGFQDPALGWVSVRAQMGGGVIHAELVPGSADAGHALGSHLSGLNAYLAEHHTPVATLTLSSPDSGWAGSGGDKGAGQQMQQGAGQQTGQQTGPETAQREETDSPSGHSEGPPVFEAAGTEFSRGGVDERVQATRLGGMHISVVA